MKKELTIFTPTYNRADLLPKAYNSLKNQSDLDFIWLIIDDGSNDDTEKLVESWKEENKIDIRYYKKKNGGKHTAYNYALNKITTKYILIALDSDDYLVNNAVELINNDIKKLKDDEVGIVTLCKSEKQSKNILKRVYDTKKLNHRSLKWALNNNQFDAECLFIFKTEYITKFKYPEYKGERFFTEAYTYYQMEGPMQWTNAEICIREYQEGGLTKNMLKLFYKNPKSWYEYNKIRMIENKSYKKRIKYMIYYIAFGIIGKEKIFCLKMKNNFKILILFPFGFLGYIYIIAKNKMKG